MKNLYEMFRHTNSHGLVSSPFLGLIQYYLEKNDHSLTKNVLTELYSILSYITLSGARDFRFEAVSDLVVELLFLLKQATLKKIKETEKTHIQKKKKKNDGHIFNPKVEDLLDTVIEILDNPSGEHEKEMFPYDPPQVQTPTKTVTETKLIDDKFIALKRKFDEVNDVATQLKTQQKITASIDDVIDEKNPFQNLGTEDIWIEEDLFDKNDSKETIELSKRHFKRHYQKQPIFDFTALTEQVITDIVDGATDEELRNDEVIVNDVTDDKATDDDLSDRKEPQEITATPACVQRDPNRL